MAPRLTDEQKRFINIVIAIILMLAINFGVAVWKYDFVSYNRDDFCQRKGYSETTDWTTYTDLKYNLIHKIECDGEEIFEVEKDTYCEEYNKWEQCVNEEGKYVVIQNNNSKTGKNYKGD